MKRMFLTLALLLGTATYATAQETTAAEAEPTTVSAELAAEKGCLSCHEGIEKFTAFWDKTLYE